MRPEYKLVHHGKEFPKRGAKWPLGAEYAARLSTDGGFLAINSWDGTMETCPIAVPAGFFCRDRSEGQYYVDIYASSAVLVLSLSGEFRRVNPDDLFERSAWISSRYYVLPLDTEKMNRFVLCDLESPPSRER